MQVINNGTSTVSVNLPVAPGSLVQQVTKIDCAADTNRSLNGKFFFLEEVGGPGAYVWFNIGGEGFDPGPIDNRTSVEVAIAEAPYTLYVDSVTSANDVATAVNTAINGLTGRFTSVVSTYHVTVTNEVGGDVPNFNINNVPFVLTTLVNGGTSHVYTWAPSQVLSFSDVLSAPICEAILTCPSLELVAAVDDDSMYLLNSTRVQTITNGDTTHVPSCDVVFDALALKLDITKLAYIDTAAAAGGGAIETVVATGLAAGDIVLSASQMTAGANGTALVSFNQAVGAITLVWSADPGAGAIVRLLVLKA